MDAAVVRSHATDFRRAQEAAKSAQANARNARKRMKDSGIDLAAWDLSQTLAKLDPVEAVIRLNRTYYYLKATLAPLGSQLGFHDILDPNTPISEEERANRWRLEGANAFLLGKREHDCPYSKELPACHAWLDGFRSTEWETNQTKSKQEINQPNPVDTIVPEAKKRGRPPKNAKPTLVVDNKAPPVPDDEEIPFVEPVAKTSDGGLPPSPPLDDTFPA